MRFEKLGKHIKLVDTRNRELFISRLLGVSIQKKFIISIANVTKTDMSVYRVINYNQFAFSPVTSRNGEKLTIALLKDQEPAILSPAYQIFKIIDESKLDSDFLAIFFNRDEFDRYSRYHSWGSARETFSWEDLCDIKIPLLPISEQKKYVDVYNALQKNQKTYDDSLTDLQLICDCFIDNLIKSEPMKDLKKYIKLVDNRNYDLAVNNLLGISVNKIFIPTKSNKEDLNLNNYKIVNERQFSFVTVTSRNGGKISIALLNGKSGLVSATYNVFEVDKLDKLLPEYLYLWFSRPEFDRYARFHSWGSARETFNWDDMCNVKLPIPTIDKQKAIVTIYHTLETRKRLNNELKESLKPLCPILMKDVYDKINKS